MYRQSYGKPEAAMKSMKKSGVWTGIYTAGVPQELAHALLLAHHRSFVPVYIVPKRLTNKRDHTVRYHNQHIICIHIGSNVAVQDAERYGVVTEIG